MSRILLIGDPIWDIATYLERPLHPGEFVTGSTLTGRPGGSVANIARALASAGHEVWLHGTIGSTENSAELLEDLVSRNIRCDWLRQVPGPSRTCLVLIDPSGERYIVSVAKPEKLTPSLPLGPVPEFDAVYVGSASDTTDALLRWVGNERSPVLFAHLGARGIKAPSTAPVHYVLGSHSDLPADWGASPWEMTRAKLGSSVRALILTRGGEGVVAYTEEGLLALPPAKLPAPPVDATGSGDAFAAALIHSLSNEGTLLDALHLGVRWGAAATQVKSSVPPAFEEIETLLLGIPEAS